MSKGITGKEMDSTRIVQIISGYACDYKVSHRRNAFTGTKFKDGIDR